MRISDWSSDVCSSDLCALQTGKCSKTPIAAQRGLLRHGATRADGQARWAFLRRMPGPWGISCWTGVTELTVGRLPVDALQGEIRLERQPPAMHWRSVTVTGDG